MVDFVIGETGAHQVSRQFEKKEQKKIENRFSLGRTAILLFSFFVLLYLFLYIRSIDAKYVDFGDGNYLYLSLRLSEGEVLYKDLPCPQPPLLLFWGGFLLWLTGGDPVLIRLWQGIQHVLTACCVLGITNRIFFTPNISVLAGIIYLFLPEGVWWSIGYQSEPLLILLQCFNLLLFLDAIRRRRVSFSLYAAAALSALCCYVNMTALPYVALQWFFVWLRFRGFFLRYTLVLVPLGVLIFLFMHVYSHGQYLEQVFFRQVGTYPTETWGQMIGYFLSKLNSEGGDILFWEGGFVLAALAGILLFSEDERETPGKEYLIWWAIFSIGSIIFVTKGGTVEYIFTLGEPAVAVFSAFFLTTIFLAADIPVKYAAIVRNPTQMGKFTLTVCLLLPALLMKPLTLLYASFTNSKTVFELSGEEMDKLKHFIQYKCPPDKLMVSPPYQAFLAQRRIAGNASELFVLAHAYFHEWRHLKTTRNLAFDLPLLKDAMPDSAMQSTFITQTALDLNRLFEQQPALSKQYPALARFYEFYKEPLLYSTQSVLDLDRMFDQEPELRQRYPVIALFLDIRKEILKKNVGLILANKMHPFFYIPPLHQAIRDYCQAIDLAQLDLKFREEKIVAYAPKP
jgi:hypothetical protein